MSTLLDSVLQKTERAPSAPPSKRARSEGKLLFHTFAETLYALRGSILTASIPQHEVEIEVRAGMLVMGTRRWRAMEAGGCCIYLAEAQRVAGDIKFNAGIDEVVFDRLKNVFLHENFPVEKLHSSRIRVDRAGTRYTMDDRNNATHIERKEKLFNHDFACTGHTYDVRLNVAREVNLPDTVPPSDWTIERMKRRLTYLPARNSIPLAWKIDLTEIESRTNASSAVSVEYEVEFELKKDIMLRWLQSTDERTVLDITNSIATELSKLFDLCIVSEHSTIPTQFLTPLSPSQYSPQIASMNSTLQQRHHQAFSFIGAMPITMTRQSLKSIQQSRYYITEKTDGVRHLLYCLLDEEKRPNAVFMNRAKQLFAVSGGHTIAEHLKPGTVVDGEFVYNRSMHIYVFLMFDILALDGRSVTALPFSERLQIINSHIKDRLGFYATCTPSNMPLLLIRKIYYAKSDVSSVLAKFTYEQGERVYRDTDRRHHKSDGLIFQGDLPYQCGTDEHLLKWKWPELASCDLQIAIDARDNSIGLMAGGPDGSLVDCAKRGVSRLGFGKFDTWRLVADVEESRHRVHIAEVAYNSKIGLWTYFQLRDDKTEPNFINTVMNIFMEQAESISIEELEYRLLARNEAENDFNKQLESMLKKAVQFQKQRTSSSSVANN